MIPAFSWYLQKVHRNLDPRLHPLERAKEYKRALNAVKLHKVFAKPFMGALGCHADAVSAMARNPVRLNSIVSASMDGGEAGFNYADVTFAYAWMTSSSLNAEWLTCFLALLFVSSQTCACGTWLRSESSA